MSITHLTSTSQLDKILAVSNDKLSVIDFHATWCGPCHAIAPKFEELSKRYGNVNFLKCDVDATPDVASRYSVRAMPTFIFLKGSTKVDQVQGADKTALEAALLKYSSASAPAGAFTGKGQTLAGSAGGLPNADFANAVNSVTNLNPQAKIFLGLIGVYLFLWYFS